MMRNKVMSAAELRWTPRIYFQRLFQYFFSILLIPCIMFMFADHLEAKDPEKGAVEKTTGHSNAEGKLHPVGLQLAWLHQFQFAGYYAAVEKGFYRDAGFKVTITEGRPGIRPVEEVVSGRANYAVGRASILLHRLHGKPVVVLASIFQHSANIFLARRESGIHTPHDMIGRRVMMLKGDDAAEYMAMFSKEGISLEQISIIPSSFDVDDLIKGKTDVFNAYSTNEPYYLETQKIPMSIIDPKTYGIDFYGDCLFTSEQELKERPDQVKAFREASLHGWQYAMAHSDEIIDLILTTYGAKKTREHLIFEALAIRKLMLPDLIQIGHMNPGRWRHIADTYVDLGMADSDYFLKGFIYDPNPRPDYTWIRWTFGVTVFLCLLIGLSSIVLFIFNRRLEAEVRQRKLAQQTLIESEQKAKQYLNIAGVIILAIDTDGNISLINERGLKVLGYRREELLGKNWFRTCLPDRLQEEVVDIYRQLMTGETKPVEYYENQIRRKNGEERIIAWHNAFLRNSSGEITGTLSSGEDITERKQVEKKLHRSNRALKTFSECNQAVVRAREEPHLLHEICRIIVDIGGYRLAWVGFAKQDEAKTVRPVAQAGYEEGYLDTLNITWVDIERGQGPTGTAIRTCKPCVVKDILTDPNYMPWRSEASNRGYESAIALPLISNDKAFGTLNIYAEEPDAFDSEEIKLLMELADDLAYGIMSLRTQAERKRAEKELEKHREHLEELVKERTSELKEKNAELERMNEVFTGREFRIKELRDRVKELELKIED